MSVCVCIYVCVYVCGVCMCVCVCIYVCMCVINLPVAVPPELVASTVIVLVEGLERTTVAMVDLPSVTE